MHVPAHPVSCGAVPCLPCRASLACLCPTGPAVYPGGCVVPRQGLPRHLHPAPTHLCRVGCGAAPLRAADTVPWGWQLCPARCCALPVHAPLPAAGPTSPPLRRPLASCSGGPGGGGAGRERGRQCGLYHPAQVQGRPRLLPDVLHKRRAAAHADGHGAHAARPRHAPGAPRGGWGCGARVSPPHARTAACRSPRLPRRSPSTGGPCLTACTGGGRNPRARPLCRLPSHPGAGVRAWAPGGRPPAPRAARPLTLPAPAAAPRCSQVRDLLPAHPHLRVVLMSATLHIDLFSGGYGWHGGANGL